MKILIVHGSPRRGNTWNILNIIKEKISERVDVEYDIVELSKVKLESCRGCFNCIFKGEDKCPHRVIMKELIDKIDRCDGLIITSPVYSMQVSGLLKNFIDHMSFNFHRPRYYNKKALVITTTAGAAEKKSADYIKEVLNYWGVNSIYLIPLKYRDNRERENGKIIDKAVDEYVEDLMSGKYKSPSLKNLCMYNIWRAMSKAPFNEGSADYDYWRESGLDKYSYYPQVKIAKSKKVLGDVVFKVMGKSINKNIKDTKK